MSRPSKISKAFDAIVGLSLRSAMRHVCGEEVGYGLYRDVYLMKQDPRFVVKIERDMSQGMFANVTEWRNYLNNRDDQFIGPWLAPCETITETGQILVMRRVRHAPVEAYPNLIPSYLTDCKRTNYGFIGKRFVCCDYSFLLSNTRHMKKARWWDSED
jgi:hypothetical protein